MTKPLTEAVFDRSVRMCLGSKRNQLANERFSKTDIHATLVMSSSWCTCTIACMLIYKSKEGGVLENEDVKGQRLRVLRNYRNNRHQSFIKLIGLCDPGRKG